MKFDAFHTGEQAFGANDLREPGANFADVRKAMFENAYYLKWGDVGEPRLPVYATTTARLLAGILPGGQAWQIKAAAARTLESKSLLRWGENAKGFRRLLHPNGVCLFGRWSIDQESNYSGYFRQGREALIVGRYSTCCTECRRGHYRSFSLAGALFPTVDENHAGLLPTATFITQQDIGGELTPFINDANLCNAPNVTPWRRGWAFPVLALTGMAFKLADKETTQRQLYEIAELGKPPGEPTRVPRFIRLTVDPAQPRIAGADIDFRDEVLGQIYDPGNPTPQRKLTFRIEVTNEGVTRGRLVQRRTFQNWQPLGQISFVEAVASYNADFVLHMHHPRWRSEFDRA